MKIAFIVNTFPSLSQTFVLNQITGLLDMGYDVEIFAHMKQNEKKVHANVERYRLMERVHYFDIPSNRIKRLLKAINLIITNFYKSPIKILKSLTILNFRRRIWSLRGLYVLIPFLDKKFDIIHCHFGPNGTLGTYLKQLGIPGKIVTMFHGYDIRLGLEKGGHIYNDLFKLGDCFLIISKWTKNHLIKFGANPQKFICHPIGIDVDKFSSRWQSNVVERPNTVIILTVARLINAKGLQYGIHSINKLLKKNSELYVEYDIIGEGPLEEQLRKLVKTLGLVESVRFLGPMEQEEVIKYYQRAHIFLLPSIAEAIPTVLMEAQAVGLPIIATSVGSISQVMIDGKSGFLVPERNVDVLVEKLDYLINHPEIWAEMGRAGRKYVEENYDIKKLNRRLVKIYNALLTDNRNALEELKRSIGKK